MLESHYQYINDLVQKIQEGDSSALEEIADFYQPLINASINRCLSREPRLKPYRDDMEQEAFLALYHIALQYDSSLSYFSYFLSTRLDYAIISRCKRQFLNQNTAGNGIEEIGFEDMPPDWEPTEENSEDPFDKIRFATALSGALDQLNQRQRDAIDLYFFQNYTQSEAASALKITQASFCKRIQRAMSKLKEILSDDFCL